MKIKYKALLNPVIILSVGLFLDGCRPDRRVSAGNVIFIHPDGTGLAQWTATRILFAGPDGDLNWDKLPYIGLYRGHVKNSLTASSQAGATIHAYGVKADYKSYGMEDGEIVTARSGKKMSIMQEAFKAGIRTGVVNSGSIIEPGTGVFLTSEKGRELSESIAKKIIESGADVIFSGGEEWLLPTGTSGRHGGDGKRTDGLNLIQVAQDLGYLVVYNREELQALPKDAQKVLGLFASAHTFNAHPEEELLARQLPLYKSSAPTLAEMTSAAIQILSRKGEQFFLVVEEEGTDNFGNHNNALGTLTALKRADQAIGVALEFLAQNPNTLIITASDSEAGGLELLGRPATKQTSLVTKRESNGAPADGIDGTDSPLFKSQPDQGGNVLPFWITWSSYGDVSGGLVSRAAGLNAGRIQGNLDNTGIYRVMYLTLFGKHLP